MSLRRAAAAYDARAAAEEAAYAAAARRRVCASRRLIMRRGVRCACRHAGDASAVLLVMIARYACYVAMRSVYNADYARRIYAAAMPRTREGHAR